MALEMPPIRGKAWSHPPYFSEGSEVRFEQVAPCLVSLKTCQVIEGLEPKSFVGNRNVFSGYTTT